MNKRKKYNPQPPLKKENKFMKDIQEFPELCIF